MGIEQKIVAQVDAELRFTGKTSVQSKRGVFICDASVKIDNIPYRVGDYIYYSVDDDFDLQASEGHIFTREVIGKISAFCYSPEKNTVVIEFEGVYEYGLGPGEYLKERPQKKYIPQTHSFLTRVLLENLKSPRKMKKEKYEKLRANG